MLTAALFAVAQDMEATYVSTDRKMDKVDVVYIYIHNRLLLSHKKEQNFVTVNKNLFLELEGFLVSRELPLKYPSLKN